MSAVDPVTLQVIQARLAGIVQEMQNSLFRTGYSTIIRESQDASCAVLNTRGEVIAQHVVLPLHMGAFPACAASILKTFTNDEITDGDAFITNHPYLGGSPHAPDMGVFTPIFFRGEWVGFAANMAHKSDIGGTVPGSGSGTAREIYQEGLHLPPVKFMSGLQPVKEIDAMIAANSRTPALVLGDLRGQVGAARLGERRIGELMERYGKDVILDSTELLSAHTESRVRRAIASWPDGESEGESFVDHDGIDLSKPIRIHVKVKKSGDRLHFDFSGSSDQTQGPANIRPPLVRAACVYCLVALVDRFLPINHGLARCIDATFRQGSVVDPRFPAAVNTYMPTALTAAEAILRALAQFVPERRIAGGSGSAALVLGGRDYGTGSSRDWAAKGTALLGVRAVLAESFERIHRSNLISMGVVPLRFAAGEGWRALGLDGSETFTLIELRCAVLENAPVRVEASGDRGMKRFEMMPDVQTNFERTLLTEGGMLPAMMKNLVPRTLETTT